MKGTTMCFAIQCDRRGVKSAMGRDGGGTED